MEKTNQNEVFTNDNTIKAEEQAKVSELFKEVLEVITDTFVATYEVEGNSMIMRIPNGQKFRISVEGVN